MKKLIFLIVAIVSVNLCAQVAIAKTDVEGGGLLDFRAENQTDSNRGLILPKLESIDTTTAVSGTIYFNGTNGQIEYLDNNKTKVAMTSNNTAIVQLPASLSDNPLGGVTISDGTSNSGAPGVLVLESNNKALILPKVDSPESSITNPHPGMIVYDLSSNSMAVYNGEKWSFWN